MPLSVSLVRPRSDGVRRHDAIAGEMVRDLMAEGPRASSVNQSVLRNSTPGGPETTLWLPIPAMKAPLRTETSAWPSNRFWTNCSPTNMSPTCNGSEAARRARHNLCDLSNCSGSGGL